MQNYNDAVNSKPCVHISNFYNDSTHVDLTDILLLKVWSTSYSVLPCFSHSAMTILSCNRLKYQDTALIYRPKWKQMRLQNEQWPKIKLYLLFYSATHNQIYVETMLISVYE